MLYPTLEIPRPCTLVKVEYPMVKLFEISEYQYIMYYKSLGIKRNILRGQKKKRRSWGWEGNRDMVIVGYSSSKTPDKNMRKKD